MKSHGGNRAGVTPLVSAALAGAAWGQFEALDIPSPPPPQLIQLIKSTGKRAAPACQDRQEKAAWGGRAHPHGCLFASNQRFLPATAMPGLERGAGEKLLSATLLPHSRILPAVRGVTRIQRCQKPPASGDLNINSQLVIIVTPNLFFSPLILGENLLDHLVLAQPPGKLDGNPPRKVAMFLAYSVRSFFDTWALLGVTYCFNWNWEYW